MGTPAKVLAPGDVRRLMTSVASRRHGLRDRALVTLSFKAGLRACEMAGLDWSMVLGPDGNIGRSLQVADDISKNGRGRRLPLHPDLKSVLLKLHVHQGRPRYGYAHPERVQGFADGHIRGARVFDEWLPSASIGRRC